MNASQAMGLWSRADRLAQRWLRLERAANLGPLLHVASYYLIFAALAKPGLIFSRVLQVLLWLVLALLNYSLTIGILHMHTHRPLFSARFLNRALDVLLCFPALLTATEMLVYHVSEHHRHGDGPRDPSSTMGARQGGAAVRYWLLYGYRCKRFTIGAIFTSTARAVWRRQRVRFIVDLAVCALALLGLALCSRSALLTIWIPMLIITHLTTGYFAWLTHAPAALQDGTRGSISTVNNVLNLFIFNQGYHHVHHRHPGIHWTEIPDKLDEMLAVPSEHIVPYWVTLNSAWRILRPSQFCQPAFGRTWKQRYLASSAVGRVRLRLLPFFAWI